MATTSTIQHNTPEAHDHTDIPDQNKAHDLPSEPNTTNNMNTSTHTMKEERTFTHRSLVTRDPTPDTDPQGATTLPVLSRR